MPFLSSFTDSFAGVGIVPPKGCKSSQTNYNSHYDDVEYDKLFLYSLKGGVILLISALVPFRKSIQALGKPLNLSLTDQSLLLLLLKI